jgi:methyl-accepting chemotaxis protein
MCISIAQVWLSSNQLKLSFAQFQEAKQQRITASDALGKAEQAKSSAQSTSDEMKRLSKDMNALYSDAKTRVDQIENITKEANPSVS